MINPAEMQPNWSVRPIHELIRHIVLEYHDCLRLELPHLERKLSTPAPGLRPFCQALEAALNREEELLFPAIRRMQAGNMNNLRSLITEEIHENERLAHLFADLQNHLPVDLNRLVIDHIRLENEVLFPRALEQLKPGEQANVVK